MLKEACSFWHNKKHFLLFLFFIIVNHSSLTQASCSPLASLPGQTIWTLLDRAQEAMLGPITYFITEADLPMTITQSGKYVLSCGARLDSGLPSTSITIATDNVSIDLQGAGIRQNFNTGGAAVYAINIAGHSNITIMNGLFGQSNTGGGVVTNTNSAFINFGAGATNIIIKGVRANANDGSEVKALFGSGIVQGLLVQNCQLITSNVIPSTQNAIDIATLNQGLFIDNFVRSTNSAFNIGDGEDIAIIRCYMNSASTAGVSINGVANNVFIFSCAVNNSANGYVLANTVTNALLVGNSTRSLGLGFTGGDASQYFNNSTAISTGSNYNGTFTGFTFTPGQVTDANYWLNLSA